MPAKIRSTPRLSRRPFVLGLQLHRNQEPLTCAVCGALVLGQRRAHGLRERQERAPTSHTWGRLGDPREEGHPTLRYRP